MERFKQSIWLLLAVGISLFVSPARFVEQLAERHYSRAGRQRRYRRRGEERQWS